MNVRPKIYYSNISAINTKVGKKNNLCCAFDDRVLFFK